MINRVKWQIILGVFWFVSAYLAAGALLPWEWAWRCAWLNLLIGMIGLLLVTRTELGDRLFYEGPRDDENSLWGIGFIWAIPVVILILAVIWWVSQLLGLFG